MQKAINNYEKSVQSRNSATAKLNNAQSNYNWAVNQRNSLNVNDFKVGVYDGDIVTYTRVCNGHRKRSTEYWKSNASAEVSSWYRWFRNNDKALKSYDADRNTNKWGWTEDYTITAEWAHIDDCSWCDNYHTTLQFL